MRPPRPQVSEVSDRGERSVQRHRADAVTGVRLGGQYVLPDRPRVVGGRPIRRTASTIVGSWAGRRRAARTRRASSLPASRCQSTASGPPRPPGPRSVPRRRPGRRARRCRPSVRTLGPARETSGPRPSPGSPAAIRPRSARPPTASPAPPAPTAVAVAAPTVLARQFGPAPAARRWPSHVHRRHRRRQRNVVTTGVVRHLWRLGGAAHEAHQGDVLDVALAPPARPAGRADGVGSSARSPTTRPSAISMTRLVHRVDLCCADRLCSSLTAPRLPPSTRDAPPRLAGPSPVGIAASLNCPPRRPARRPRPRRRGARGVLRSVVTTDLNTLSPSSVPRRAWHPDRYARTEVDAVLAAMWSGKDASVPPSNT
jgi:hypothetical protein